MLVQTTLSPGALGLVFVIPALAVAMSWALPRSEAPSVRLVSALAGIAATLGIAAATGWASGGNAATLSGADWLGGWSSEPMALRISPLRAIAIALIGATCTLASLIGMGQADAEGSGSARAGRASIPLAQLGLTLWLAADDVWTLWIGAELALLASLLALASHDDGRMRMAALGRAIVSHAAIGLVVLVCVTAAAGRDNVLGAVQTQSLSSLSDVFLSTSWQGWAGPALIAAVVLWCGAPPLHTFTDALDRARPAELTVVTLVATAPIPMIVWMSCELAPEAWEQRGDAMAIGLALSAAWAGMAATRRPPGGARWVLIVQSWALCAAVLISLPGSLGIVGGVVVIAALAPSMAVALATSNDDVWIRRIGALPLSGAPGTAIGTAFVVGVLGCLAHRDALGSEPRVLLCIGALVPALVAASAAALGSETSRDGAPADVPSRRQEARARAWMRAWLQRAAALVGLVAILALGVAPRTWMAWLRDDADDLGASLDWARCAAEDVIVHPRGFRPRAASDLCGALPARRAARDAFDAEEPEDGHGEEVQGRGAPIPAAADPRSVPPATAATAGELPTVDEGGEVREPLEDPASGDPPAHRAPEASDDSTASTGDRAIKPGGGRQATAGGGLP